MRLQAIPWLTDCFKTQATRATGWTAPHAVEHPMDPVPGATSQVVPCDDDRLADTEALPSQSPAAMTLRGAAIRAPARDTIRGVSTRNIRGAAGTGDTHAPAESALAVPTPRGRAAPRGPVQLSPGLTMGQYELIRLLGRGGMGEVYLARDLRLARLVAIKFLSKSTPAVRTRFLAEARTTAQCNHENIVVIHEVGEHDDCPYLVLEYLKGQTLRQWWKENTEPGVDVDGYEVRTRLPPRRVVELMVPVLRALASAHARGIVHRDLKPENIMLTESGTTKVLDFGIAKRFTDETTGGGHESGTTRWPAAISLTATGGLLGTLPYMSPEQLEGEEIDHRTDLWAVGIMLFELALGRHPMLRGPQMYLLDVVDLDEPMPGAVQLAPELGALGAIIDRCLIKPRADRIDSARTLLAELEALLPGRAALAEDSSPFAGLLPFQESDADRFFGRDGDIVSLVTRVRSQPLTAVVGPSGAGKSSLVRAGLIPALERSGEGWAAHVVRPGRSPLTVLASLLSSLSRAPSTGGELTGGADAGAQPSAPAHPCERLSVEPGAFGAALRAWARRKRRRVLIFVDQFEELYTLGAGADERAAFTACLDGAADDPNAPVRVVLSIRADFFERLTEHRSFMDQVSRSLYFVAPLERGGLRKALVRPIEAADHAFEDPTVVDEMLDALEGTAGALPLLQFAADSLWSRRDARRRLLTRASYDSMGGIAGALARHADAVLASVPARKLELVRAICEHLVTPERTRAVASLRELCTLPADRNDVVQVLDDLARARLVVIKTDPAAEHAVEDDDGNGYTSNTTIEIVHESLIEEWPTLRRWLDESQEDAVFLARLRAAVEQWEKNKRAEGMLWRDESAREAQRWREHYGGKLSDREHAYLDAVLALASQAARTKRSLILGLIGFLLSLVVAASVALIWIRRAEQTAREQAALARERAAVAGQRLVEVQQAREQMRRAFAQEVRARAEAQKAARDARMASEKEQQARTIAEDALREARQASIQERRARKDAEHALLSAEAAAREARMAEQEARAAQQEAVRSAEAERRVREELPMLIERALGPLDDGL
jgi:serine/threonine protein kinase